MKADAQLMKKMECLAARLVLFIFFFKAPRYSVCLAPLTASLLSTPRGVLHHPTSRTPLPPTSLILPSAPPYPLPFLPLASPPSPPPSPSLHPIFSFPTSTTLFTHLPSHPRRPAPHPDSTPYLPYAQNPLSQPSQPPPRSLPTPISLYQSSLPQFSHFQSSLPSPTLPPTPSLFPRDPSQVAHHILTVLQGPHPHTGINLTSVGCLPSAANLYALSLAPLVHSFQYAVPLTYVPRLQQFSLCLRFQVKDTSRSHFLLSYAVQGQDNAILLFLGRAARPGLGLYVNNVRAKSSVTIRQDVWYAACAVWRGAAGWVELYLDGRRVARKKNKCQGCTVEAGGVAVVGVEQDTRGGGFKSNQVSHALVTDLNLWSTALPHHSLITLSQCYSKRDNPIHLSSEDSAVETNAFDEDSAVKIDQSGNSVAGDEGSEERDGMVTNKIISWGQTPFAVMGGVLIIPIMPP